MTYTLYHGSASVIDSPMYGLGNIHNDYGLAFYCTQSEDMAKEWAVSDCANGFSNKYLLDMNGLTELNLNCGEYHILNWLAILLENRTFRVDSDIKKEGMKYILDNFLVQYKSFDVIRGYRADDSYFSFANAFLNNGISLKQLEKAMYLGGLGEQIAVRSSRAFDALEFAGAETADRALYYPSKKARDDSARADFRRERGTDVYGTYLIDIMRQSWRNNDERLQRILFR